METLTLTFTVAQLQVLMDALGQMPYVRVYRLMAEIQRQAQAQWPLTPPTDAPTQEARP